MDKWTGVIHAASTTPALQARCRSAAPVEDYGDLDIEMLLNHFGTLYNYLGGDEAAVMREWVRLKRLVITL